MKEMIERFFDEYGRIPMYKEYVSLGGTVSKTHYYYLLNSMGYKASHKGNVYSVEILEDGSPIFVGTTQDIADELGCSVQMARKRIYDGKEINGYTLRKKPNKEHPRWCPIN